MIGEGWNEFILRHPRVVERAMGIKCETVNCAWEKSVPGRSWRSTMLRGEKAGTPSPTSHHPCPSRGLILEDTKGGKTVRGEGKGDDLNARSKEASKELEICYVVCRTITPQRIWRKISSSVRGGGCLVPLLTVEGRRGLVGRFAVEEEAGRGGGGWWTRCQEYKARDERDGGHICDS